MESASNSLSAPGSTRISAKSMRMGTYDASVIYFAVSCTTKERAGGDCGVVRIRGQRNRRNDKRLARYGTSKAHSFDPSLFGLDQKKSPK